MPNESPFIRDRLIVNAPYTQWCIDVCCICEGTALSDEDELCHECDHVKRPAGSPCEYCEDHPGQDWIHWVEYQMTSEDRRHDMNLFAETVLGQSFLTRFMEEGLDTELAYRREVINE